MAPLETGSRRWLFLTPAGERGGPFSTAEILERLIDRSIPVDSLLCEEGTCVWQAARELEQFRVAARAVRASENRKKSIPPQESAREVDDVPTQVDPPLDETDPEEVMTALYGTGQYARERANAATSAAEDEDELETKNRNHPAAAQSQEDDDDDDDDRVQTRLYQAERDRARIEALPTMPDASDPAIANPLKQAAASVAQGIPAQAPAAGPPVPKAIVVSAAGAASVEARSPRSAPVRTPKSDAAAATQKRKPARRSRLPSARSAMIAVLGIVFGLLLGLALALLFRVME